MNTLTAFQFENDIAHGAIVELSDGVADMLGARHYEPDVVRLVGEAMAAMPLLATHLRFEGRINLQFQGEKRKTRVTASGRVVGPVIDPDAPYLQLLVAQIDHRLQLRGMAKASPGLAGSFTELLQGGLLSLMMEPDNDSQPASQALVLIEGDSLAEALEGYFARSEQLPTLIRLATRGGRLCGFMLQRLPLENTKATEEDWNHLLTLAQTLTQDELLDVEAPRLLGRLFANEPLRLFRPRPVNVACRCSREGIGRMLQSLGREEVDAILTDQGKAAVTCEFCGREYVFTPVDAAQLFVVTAPSSDTRH